MVPFERGLAASTWMVTTMDGVFAPERLEALISRCLKTPAKIASQNPIKHCLSGFACRVFET
jgi:hypothetical protein